MNIQQKKIWKDLKINKRRTILVILSIFLGIFGTGLIINCYSITKREMNKSYMATNPSSFNLYINKVDGSLISELKKLPDITSIEERQMLRSRTQNASNEWITTYLYVVDDFNNLKIDTFKPEDGSSTPGKDEIVFERVSMGIAKCSINDFISLKTPNNEPYNLKLVGSVHAPGLKPAWMEGCIYGYITRDTLNNLGGSTEDTVLSFVVSENRFNKDFLHEKAFSVKEWCQSHGYNVSRIEVPTPGKHPNGDQMQSLLFLFEVFGVLSLVLSGVLVINMTSSILSGHIRQIAIMKAIGASKLQIALMYYSMVFAYGLVALIFAFPCTILGAISLSNVSAGMLNFTISSYSIPFSAYLVQILAGILIPLLAATYPILKGCNISVVDALRDYGISKKQFGSSNIDLILGKIKGTKGPVILSIRNTFRQKGRLLLTLGTLSLGGAILIVAINVKYSLDNTISNAMKVLNYDIQYTFSKNCSEQDIKDSLQGITGIKDVECFSGSMASMVYDDNTNSNSFQLVAAPDNIQSLNLPIIEGRWITPEDTNAIVINHQFLNKEPNLKLNDTITISSSNRLTKWTIVGIAREVGAISRAYVNQKYYQNTFEQPGKIRLAILINDQRNPSTESIVAKASESAFLKSNLDVYVTQRISQVKTLFDNHLSIIAGFLIIASILIILVGAMGLISSTQINIMERTRELGIMQAIGGTPANIKQIVLFEGIIISIISFIISLLLSIPLSYYIGDVFGNIFLQTSLDNVISPIGIIIWLCLIILITIVVSVTSTNKMLKMTISETLNYE